MARATLFDFVYTLLYPGVLGSMLYEVLQPGAWDRPVRWIELAVVVLYCLDYLHLRSHLQGLDPIKSADITDALLDTAIAIIFGVAFHSVSNSLPFACGCLAGMATLALIYNFHARSMHRIVWRTCLRRSSAEGETKSW